MDRADETAVASGLTVVLLTAGVLALGSNALVLSPILDDVAADLGARPAEVARAISAFGAATALSAFLLAGRADHWGMRRALTGTAALLALGLALSALARGWVGLAAAQALAGLASGIMLPATYATATATAPKGREAQRLGVVLSGWGLSLVAGVPMAAIISNHAGWRAAYLALAGVLALVALGFAARLPHRARRAVRPRSVPTAWLLRQPGIALILASWMTAMAAFYGSFAFYGQALRQAMGVDATGAGVYVLVYGAGFGAASMLAAYADRLGPRRLLPLVFGALTVIYAVLPWALHRPATAAAISAAWGFANQTGLNATVLALARRAPQARAAVMGLQSGVTYTAVFFGPLVAGWLMARHGFGPVGWAAAGSVLLGTLGMLRLRPSGAA